MDHKNTSCSQCIKRLATINDLTRQHHGIRASEIFRVTAPSGVHDGHLMYHSSIGVIALCQAGQLKLATYRTK